MYLAVYDISDGKRLKRISGILQRYGRRVQESVFECELERGRYEELRDRLKQETHAEDKLFIYHLPANTGKEKI